MWTCEWIWPRMYARRELAHWNLHLHRSYLAVFVTSAMFSFPNECLFSFYYYCCCCIFFFTYFVRSALVRTHFMCMYRNKLEPATTTRTRNDTDLFNASHKASNIHLNAHTILHISIHFVSQSFLTLSRSFTQTSATFISLCNEKKI